MTNQPLSCASINASGNADPVYALDVWTVVDIFGMWVVGPRLYWGFCEFSEVSILSAVAVLLCCSFGPLRVLSGNSNITAGLRKGRRRRPLLSALLGAPLTTASMAPGAPRIDLCHSSPRRNQVSLKYAISRLLAGGATL